MYKKDVKRDYNTTEKNSGGFNSKFIKRAIIVFILIFGGIFYFQNSEKINEFLSDKITKKENKTEKIEQERAADSTNEINTEEKADTAKKIVIDEIDEFEDKYNKINDKYSTLIEKYSEFEPEITDLIAEAIISDKTDTEIDHLLNDYVKSIAEKKEKAEKKKLAAREEKEKEAKRKAKEIADANRIKNDNQINVRIIYLDELDLEKIDIQPEDKKIIKNAPQVLKIDLEITNGKDTEFQLSNLELMLDINGSRTKLMQKSTVKEKKNQLSLIAERNSDRLAALSQTNAYILCALPEKWNTLVLKSPSGKGFRENWSELKIFR